MTPRARLLLAATLARLSITPPALAGGPPPSMVAVGGRVWIASDTSVTEIDPFEHRAVRHPATPYPYPTGLGASDGFIWITSVTNGYTAAAITRVPFDRADPGHGSISYPHRPIYDLAVGSGTTWLLLGPWNHIHLVAIDQATNRPQPTRTGVPIPHDLDWIAADNTGATPGLYGIAGTDLVRIHPDGTTTLLRQLGVQPAGHPIVADGRIFVPDRQGVSRIDATTGRLEGRLALPLEGATLTFGDDTLWLLRLRSTDTGSTTSSSASTPPPCAPLPAAPYQRPPSPPPPPTAHSGSPTAPPTPSYASTAARSASAPSTSSTPPLPLTLDPDPDEAHDRECDQLPRPVLARRQRRREGDRRDLRSTGLAAAARRARRLPPPSARSSAGRTRA